MDPVEFKEPMESIESLNPCNPWFPYGIHVASVVPLSPTLADTASVAPHGFQHHCAANSAKMGAD